MLYVLKKWEQIEMRKLVVTLLMCLFIGAGCSESVKKTELVEKFPESNYMTATGIGESEIEARNRAVAELSRIFESKVYSDTLDRIKTVISTSKGEETEQRVESNIKVMSAVELKGVKIGREWYDEKTRNYYALAVLDRYQAKENWLNELEEWDRKIESEARAAGALQSDFLVLKSLRKVVSMWLEREVIVSRLSVLGFNAAPPASFDMGSVYQQIARLKKEMKISLEISGKQSSVLKDVIGESLGEKGYLMSSDRVGSDVVISGSVKTEPVKLDNPGWEFCRATVSLNIKDMKTGLSVADIEENVRAGHVSYSEAVNKAIKKVSGTVATKLIDFLEN